MISLFSRQTFKKQGLFGGIFVFSAFGVLSPGLVFAEEDRCSVRWKLAVCQPANFRSTGKTYFEMEQDRRVRQQSRRRHVDK